jgi:hypothetical protein
MLIIIEDRNYRKLYFDVEPSDTIFNVKSKIIDRTGYDYDEFCLYFKGEYLGENHTLADYNIQKESILRCGYQYNLIFEGKYYKKTGTGCAYCHGDLFGFIAEKTGIPREELYLVNGSEKILDKDFNIKECTLKEYYFIKKDSKIIKIKMPSNNCFYISVSKELDYYKLIELIAKNHFNYFNIIDDQKYMKFKENLLKNFNLILNGRIIDEKEDLNEIGNVTKIEVIRKTKNLDKKE